MEKGCSGVNEIVFQHCRSYLHNTVCKNGWSTSGGFNSCHEEALLQRGRENTLKLRAGFIIHSDTQRTGEEEDGPDMITQGLEHVHLKSLTFHRNYFYCRFQFFYLNLQLS